MGKRAGGGRNGSCAGAENCGQARLCGENTLPAVRAGQGGAPAESCRPQTGNPGALCLFRDFSGPVRIPEILSQTDKSGRHLPEAPGRQ